MTKLTRLQREKDKKKEKRKKVYPNANPRIRDTVFKKLFSEPEKFKDLNFSGNQRLIKIQISERGESDSALDIGHFPTFLDLDFLRL